MDEGFESEKFKSANPAGAGFTLLEVVIALIVMGVCMGVLFQSLSRSKQLSWKSDETVTAVAMARNLFSERPLVDKALETGRSAGRPRNRNNGLMS